MTDFLLRLSLSQTRVSPHSVALPKRRSGSPMRGSSTLITSAPNSASKVAQNGPAMKVAMSSTRTPSSGRAAVSVGFMAGLPR